MVKNSMKQKQSAHFLSHMIKVGFAVLLLTFGVLGFCAAPAAAEDTTIYSVSLEIPVPAYDEIPCSASDVVIDDDAKYSVKSLTWVEETSRVQVEAPNRFLSSSVYAVELVLEADSSYFFNSGVNVYINRVSVGSRITDGNNVIFSESVSEDRKILTLWYTFPATVQAISEITLYDLKLPNIGDYFTNDVAILPDGYSIRIGLNPEMVKWYKEDSDIPLDSTDIRLANTEYSVEINISYPEFQLYFNDTVAVIIPGENSVEYFEKSSKSLLKVRHTFSIPIETIVISNLIPVSGTPLKTDLKIIGDDVIPITDYTIRWYDSDYTTEYSGDSISKYGNTYVAKIYITAPDGYLINKNLNAYYDNNYVSYKFIDSKCVITYKFNPTKVQLSVTPIPDKINLGDMLTVSGTATGFAGECVTVDLVSTAFLAVPIDQVRERSRCSGTSEINSDGTWSVTLDTSNLYPDEYACIVGGDSFVSQTSRIFVRGSEPTQPTAEPTPKPSTADLELKRGWNFISVPFELSASHNTAADVFAGVNTNENAILSYNAKNQVWEQVKATTIIAPLNAYWIYSVEDKTITLTFNTDGVHAPASKAVYKGWNAVGISTGRAMTVADIFNNIKWRTYLIWSSTSQVFDTTFIKGNKDRFSEDTSISSIWKGGWLFMDEENIIIGYV